MSPPASQTVTTILQALGETEPVPTAQVEAIVRVLGENAALEILVEADDVERRGGMKVPDGSRRRTPGGVYFVLARNRLSDADRKAIFARPSGPRPPKDVAGLPAADGGPATVTAPDGTPVSQPQSPGLVRLGPGRRAVVVTAPPKPRRAQEWDRRGAEPAPKAFTTNRDGGPLASPAPHPARPPVVASPETVKQVILEALDDLPRAERRQVLLEVLKEIGEVQAEPAPTMAAAQAPAEVAPAASARMEAQAERVQAERAQAERAQAERAQAERAQAEQAHEERQAGRREELIVAAGRRLGATPGELAVQLFGVDDAKNRRRVRTILSRLERSAETVE